MANTVLIVDDNLDNLKSLELALSRSPYTILTADSGQAALDRLRSDDIDVVITDLKMPEIDGMEVLRSAGQLTPPPDVIMVTAYGTVESAVDAMKQGAYDYLTKPININELRVRVDRAMAHQRLLQENIYLHTQIDKRYGFEGMIGETQEMQHLFEKVRLIAKSKATVLVMGESGTGKELLAKAIHYNSPRAKKPFLPVHCAALTETLLESELFGHERGAFTGAVSRKQGRLELADGGTLFLDEVAEIPLSMQVKLLRVLETKEFMRVGGVTPIHVDVRVIAASNRNLQEEVEEGRFREDLFYRLNVVSFELPPLRNRKGDIPVLVKKFVDECARENHKTVRSISPKAMARLVGYHWPGNIRELRNCIENTIVFLVNDTIDVADLPPNLQETDASTDTFSVAAGQSLDLIEKQYIQQTLLMVDGNRTKAAQMLGISRRTLQRKLKELGIDAG
jgi:DNA-binding NtrC family response regulator